MEFTQPLGAGLGFVVRINNQCSHPACMGRCTDSYTTINDTQEISWNTGYLLSNIICGDWEIHRNGIPCGQCADDADSRVAVDDIMGKSHKTIAQINHTNESHKMITQDRMMSHPRMEMMNNAFRCSRATQVNMEDLRLVNLTEFHPSQRGE